MDADDARVAQPDGFHFLGVEAFEGVVKSAVGGKYCFAIGHDVVRPRFLSLFFRATACQPWKAAQNRLCEAVADSSAAPQNDKRAFSLLGCRGWPLLFREDGAGRSEPNRVIDERGDFARGV